MTFEQFLDAMPHLQLQDLRFLARVNDGMRGDDCWQMIYENSTEEQLVTTIQRCRDAWHINT